MKNKALPFTTIKTHFETEQFSPVQVNGVFELQSANFVLVGIKGNPYGFASAENAGKWLDTTLIKTSKSGETKQEHIDKLIIQNSITPASYLQTEIDVIEARNAGEWSIYFSDDLLTEWGEVAKGDKGDKGDTGAAGASIQGPQGPQGIQGPAGASGITWQFPIGHLLFDTTMTNPATWLGYGTWQDYGAGKVLIGLDSTQTEFDTLGKTGGEKAHTMTVNEMPSHTHTQNAHLHQERGTTATSSGTFSHLQKSSVTGSAGAANEVLETTSPTTATNNNTGGGAAFNILQPYIVVKFWKRTA